MKLVAVSIALVLGSMTAQEYPHAFPRVGTTRLFDNDRVTVWEVNWKKNVPQPFHRHRYDMAGVYLRFGKITVTTPDGEATVGEPFEVPRPYFQLKGITHKEEAFGGPDEPERLAIMIDLKDTPPPPAYTKAGLPAAFPRENARNVLENDRVRMWDYTWPSAGPGPSHVHERDAIEVFVDGGSIQTTTDDGRTETHTVAFKDARFVPRGHVDREAAGSGAPHAIIVELK